MLLPKDRGKRYWGDKNIRCSDCTMSIEERKNSGECFNKNNKSQGKKKKCALNIRETNRWLHGRSWPEWIKTWASGSQLKPWKELTQVTECGTKRLYWSFCWKILKRLSNGLYLKNLLSIYFPRGISQLDSFTLR